MTAGVTADPALGELAAAILIPPFPGGRAPGWISAALHDGLAGVTLFGPNVAGRRQLAALTASLRGAAASPVIAIDEEGGDVTRIAHADGSDYPGNAALGAVDDTALTLQVYAALGAELAALGISLDLAPAADVATAPGNPVVGTRSFGADPGLVARHTAAAVTGLQSAGVAACAKHFPGHGSTATDSHQALATVSASLRELRRRDLPPFEAAIAAGVRAVMPGHLRVPELTGELPASLSHRALTGLLRGELGFTGVIVSDALEMRAVAGCGIPEAAVQAVLAGTDLLCLGREQDQAVVRAVQEAITGAVASGRLPGRRLEEAAQRVAELRAWTAAQAVPAAHGLPDAGRGSVLGLAAARRAIRTSGSLPQLRAPLVIQLVPPDSPAAGPVPWGLADYVPPGSCRDLATTAPPAELGEEISALLTQAAGRSVVVVVRDAHQHPAAAHAAARITEARPDAVVVEMGLPAWQPPAGRYLATYGASRSNGRAAAEALGLTGR